MKQTVSFMFIEVWLTSVYSNSKLNLVFDGLRELFLFHHV